MILKAEHLLDDKLDPEGTYLVVELTQEHFQDRVAVIPAGTRGIVTGSRDDELLVLFPRSKKDPMVFREGSVRVLKIGEFKAIGRVNR